MDRRLKRNGAPLFAFIHLFYQEADRLRGNLINLLSDRTDGDDCLAGDRRIVEAHQKKIIRKLPVPSHEQIDQDVCVRVVGDEQSLFKALVFRGNIFQNI